MSIVLTVLPRSLPDLHFGCDMDHNQLGARHEARRRPAVCLQFGQLVEPRFWPALSEQSRSTICPG